jgi:type VI secretion system protein ImpI
VLAIRLTIVNETALPDGGPLSITVTGKRGIDIGRDHHLDWVLPDPTRYISGKHCEIRFRDNGYWLHDVSTNGTYLNGSSVRMPEPRRLRQDDQLEIGRYLVRVEVTEAADPRDAADPPMVAPPAAQLWDVGGEAAEPAPLDDFRPRRSVRPLQSDDVMAWAMDLPPIATPAADEPAPGPRPVPITPRRPSLPDISADPWLLPAEGAPAARTSAGDQPPPAEPVAAPAPAVDPPPAPAASPAAAPVPAAATGDRAQAGQDVLLRFARGAGIAPEALAGRNAGDLAEELGALMHLTTVQLRQLLAARAESKGVMRSAQQTMVEALDNNPVRFCPTPEEALKVMFGPPTRSYLGARAALERSFGDVKTHQIDTFAAMQQALQGMVQQLDPKAIDAATEQEGAIGAVFTSRKTRLWDIYTARWQALTSGHERGFLGAFMLHFANAYDRQRRKE